MGLFTAPDRLPSNPSSSSLNELELESLKQRVKTSESEAAGLRSAQAALFSAHNAIRKDFELAKTRISQLEREKTALKALEPARQAEMAKLRTRLIEIEAETGQQKGKWVEQLQERNRTLRHDLDAANWKIEKDAADMVGMKKSVARLEDENGRLRTMLQSAIQRQDADAEIIRRLEDEQRVFEKQLAILSRHAVERNKLVEDLEMERHNLARDKELLASQLILVEHQVELLEKELAVQKETMQAELRNLAEQEARARDDNGLLEDELAVLQEQRRKLEHDLRM